MHAKHNPCNNKDFQLYTCSVDSIVDCSRCVLVLMCLCACCQGRQPSKDRLTAMKLLEVIKLLYIFPPYQEMPQLRCLHSHWQLLHYVTFHLHNIRPYCRFQLTRSQDTNFHRKQMSRGRFVALYEEEQYACVLC